MDLPEEKFFEQLANGSNVSNNDDENEDEYKIDLVKARTIKEKNLKQNLINNSEEDISNGKNNYDESDDEDEQEGQLTVDVYQTPDDIVIKSAIAGVKPEDLDITASNDSITIRGKRRKEREAEDRDYLYQECYWGKFSRSIMLPQEIDPDKASVSMRNGILTVRLPKMNRKKTKKLKVKAG